MQPGEVLDARFRIEREAGSGGMGIVFRAHDLHTGEPVAIKVVKAERRYGARFQREARVLSQLAHPAIVRYAAHGVTAAGAMYLAMEWIEGEDLAERLASGPLGIADAIELARRVADALALAHARGIVHRDLKPNNLLLPGGDVRQVKLLDFGVARVQNASLAMTAAGAVIGTPGYMAPEQARGEHVLDARADVFSLGCVLFECLTGRAAFVGENVLALLGKILMEEPPRVSELRDGVPASLDAIVARMLAKPPASRPADGAAARDLLAAVEPVTEEADVVRPSAITRGEQHVVSVVIAAGPPKRATGPQTEAIDEDEDGEERPETSLVELLGEAAVTDLMSSGPELAVTEVAEVRAPALDALVRLGARVERLAHGAIIATLHGTGAATDQAAQAARCALALRRASPDAPMVLATGRALVAGRLPIGPVIESAAKLLRAVGREPGIHLDAVTAGLLPSRFSVREGTFGPELGDEEQDADVPRTVLGRTTRFVGREPEMGTLSGLYAQVEAESIPRAAIVTGAPGLGKSRLREELVRKLRELDPAPAIWIGAAEPLGAGTPLGILARVVRAAMGGTGDRARIVERVRSCVPADDALRVATFLAELVGAPLDADPALPHADVQLQAARREPPLMAEQMQRAFVELLAAECAAQPIVLVLEDAQWGDLPSMKLVDAALRELPESPLLAIAFARPEIEDAFPGLWAERGVLRLSLGALTPRAADRLARDVLRASESSAIIARIVAQAAGNPFFLEELLRAYAGGAQGTMPETLLAVLQKRLEVLDEDARRLLRAASVYGGVFWRGAAAALVGAKDPDLDPTLADLLDRELLVRRLESRIPGQIEYAFRHALVRDAAYQMLTDADRTLGHRFAGEWLEAAGEANRALLAEHFERGGDRERATQSYAKAAAQALHADDLDGCLRLAARGLALAPDESDARGALHLARAEAHHWRAEFDLAHREVDDALHLLTHSSDPWFEAVAIAVAAAATLGHADEAARRAEELASAVADPTPAFLNAAAQCVAYLPPGEPGDTLLARLPGSDDAGAEALVAARVRLVRGMRANASGDMVHVLEHFARAAEHFERAGHRRGARAARANAGYASTELGRHEEAEVRLRDALEEARRAGAQGTVAWAAMHLGMVLGRLGRTSEALAVEREAADLAEKQGNVRLGAEVSVATADIFNASGAPDLAAEHAIRARDATDAPALRAAALSALATAYVALGRIDDCEEASAAAVRIFEQERGVEEVGPIVWLARAESLHARGLLREAREALETAKRTIMDRARAIPDPEGRETFLRRVPVNARILQLERAWSDP